MSIPIDIFGDRRSQGAGTSPLNDVKPENLMMAAAEMHRMGRFEDLKAPPTGKVTSPLAGQRSKLK